ncbi:SulP family inorganic anion transporter [Chitinimonas koreensis]|uniref:SulP family inorganic anion transporter n=1 Tax=Chitinimonas koreensis TaxID=356302 RepID=UPI00040425FC|nr:SulP family inorganic anion transporter [Chitinimonas koreensis]QNM98418.1 STAS domain-containing protein [Chitinimonas koreensis]
MISVLEAKRAGLFGKGKWAGNIVAGLIVGVVALPLAMAFAIASGARPEQGIYTAIIGGLAVSLLGGSRVQIAGPTGAFVAILSGITAQYGIEGLQLATLMAGLMLIVMGAVRMGAVIRFIPSPVIIGFTTGIAVIIWVGQWKDFLGLAGVGGPHFHDRLASSLLALPHLHVGTAAIGVLSLILTLYSKRVPGLGQVPGPLVALVVTTLWQWWFPLPGVATIGSAYGGIPSGLPAYSPPSLNPALIIQLVGPAFTVAMLGAMESLLSAVVADGMTGTRHDSNQELIGQGIANVIVPLFGGFAATGAIARTATSIRHGGNSPLAGVAHVLTLTVVLLVAAPYAAFIPLATLAAILFVVAYNMSELHRFKHVLLHAPRADAAILLITFALTVLVDLVVAVNIGVILAILHFMRRMVESVEVQHMTGTDLKHELAELGWTQLPKGALVYEIAGPLFFGAVGTFEHALLRSLDAQGVLILRLRKVPFIDMTALQSLVDVIQELRDKGVTVLVCEANHRVMAKLGKAGVLGELGAENYVQDFALALAEAGRRLAESPPLAATTTIGKWLEVSKAYFGHARHGDHDEKRN